MAPDEAQINCSLSDTPPHVEKMKEPTRDTFVMLLNPSLEVMWAWSNGGSVRNHSAEHWWCPKTSWRWNNTGRSQWWKQDTGQLSILMCQILAQALQLILRGPLCSQTGARMIAGRVNVAWIQCRQRMRQNRTTACSSIPCTASTAPAVAFLPGAMCLQTQGCQWGKHLSYHQKQLRHWSFPGIQIISLSQSSFEFFPMNVNILGVLCWLQLHRLEFKSALWTPEDGSLRRIGEDVNKESHHPTQQSPALAGSLSGNGPDFWSSPPPPQTFWVHSNPTGTWGITSSSYSPYANNFLQSGREIFLLFVRSLKILPVPNVRLLVLVAEPEVKGKHRGVLHSDLKLPASFLILIGKPQCPPEWKYSPQE